VRPDLSVVIGAHTAAGLDACLAALHAQEDAPSAQIIVAVSAPQESIGPIRRAYPDVRMCIVDAGATLPQLRAAAIVFARGAVIAVLDPFSLVRPDWMRQVVRAHQERPNLAIGGAVELHDAERQSLGAWATYINEYGMFMPPLRGGATDILPGSNISYKRTALFDAEDRPRHARFWKTFVNRQLQQEGSPLWLAPSIVVALAKPVPFWDFFRTRFDHGRCFAAMRTSRSGRAERWLRATSFPFLPAVLLCRWSAAYLAKRRRTALLLLTMPAQLLLFSSWALGEGTGYARGAGTSCARLFY
jgi:hypothetical protein